MRKFIICTIQVFTLVLFSQLATSQCAMPCPQVFNLYDSINCNRVEVMKNQPGPGYQNNFSQVRSCQNSLMKYTINVDETCYAGTTFTFVSISGGTFVSLSGNSFTILWGSGTSGQVQIAFTTPGGPNLAPCSDVLTINFTLVNAPLAAFTASPQPVCNSNPTTINFNSSASSNATSFYWNFGDSYTSVQANPSHTYTSPGTYLVTLIAANNTISNGQPICPTCLDTIQQNIVIDILPAPIIECVATVCAGDVVKYCAADNTCANYNWSVIGGTIQSGQGTSCVTIQWGNGNPQGSITLVPTGCATTYCASGTTVTVPIIPTTGIITGPTLMCINTTTSYSLPSWPGTTYSWFLSGGGAFTPFNTNTNQVNINWNTAGNHIITCTYFDTALNCGGSATYNVMVRNKLSITGPISVCQGQSSNLNAVIPTNIPVNSNWTISPGTATINSGNGTGTINVTWPTAGSYTITAIPVTPNVSCSNASYNVNVVAAPVISNIIGADSICPGKPYVYSAVSSGIGTYSWAFTNASSFTLLGVNNDSVQVVWGSTGPYGISLSQTSIPNGCPSNTFIKNVFPWPAPALTGPTTVCADAVVTYTITNITNANFQWSVSPANFGTIQSGQGTNTVTILWHGNNSPGTSNTVSLNYGVCGASTISVNINEPPVLTITQSGTLCGTGGVTLSTGVTGVFTWFGPGVPPPGNTSSITGITIPGNYTVQVQNINSTGCTVTANYNIPDVGRPVASISADNVLNYCLPNLPNMNLVAVNAPGYTFQWYQAPATLLPGQTNATLPINSLTTAGTYSYYCVVTLGGCVVTSNTITIIISNCPGTGCTAAIGVTNIAGCNPFTLTIAATAPSGAVLSGTGNPTIEHLEDNYIVSGLTTRTYTSIGYKQIRVCADVLLPNSTICRACKDTVVNVTVAPNFTSVVNCEKINLYDASTVVAPATIISHSWTVGTNPGNTPVPPVIASFNNNAIPNPVLTFTQSGSYIVNLTITSGTCTVTTRDTFNISVPNANFNFSNSCVGTPINFNDATPEPVHFWDFGDASTSYVNPTSHAYASSGPFSVKHIVTDANGCKDTVTNIVNISPAPVCTVTLSGPATFCYKDTVILGSSCAGLTSFQWYNNGVAISGATNPTDTVTQTGNYHFIAYDVNGCKVVSDTVAINVTQGPNVTIIENGSRCSLDFFVAYVPTCTGCTYQWEIDGSPLGNSTTIAGTIGTGQYTIGTHTFSVLVTNSLGCTDTSSITVTFNPQPSLTVNVTGPLPVCSNNLYTFTATSNATTPGWAWSFANTNFVLSTTNSIFASANGTYYINVIDSLTGCKNQASQQILRSPLLNLFPSGCDTLCDTSKVYLPLASMNGNLSGYTINWYDNAPPYSPVIGSGNSLLLSTLPPGSHNLSVIVTSPNGCQDTSSVYSIFIKPCNIVLPIRGLSINVRQTGALALVGWTVEQEIDNDHFVVEKSYNGSDFIFLQKVMSRGNSTTRQYYSIYDTLNTVATVVYYRVRAVDRIGTTDYSPVAKLNLASQNKESMLLLPNITRGEVNMVVQSNAATNTILKVYTTNGVLVYSHSVRLIKGTNRQKLNLEHLLPGYYIVTLNTGGSQLTERLVKQ